MPDFLAGQTLTDAHFPPTVWNEQNDSFQFTNTSFGVTTSGGTYVTCGVAFVAPTTGRVKITYCGDVDNNTAGATTSCSPHVRTGATVGSGSDVVAASLDNRIRNTGTDNITVASFLPVSGLTPGADYNVRLEHSVSANEGTLVRRKVMVEPVT